MPGSGHRAVGFQAPGRRPAIIPGAPGPGQQAGRTARPDAPRVRSVETSRVPSRTPRVNTGPSMPPVAPVAPKIPGAADRTDLPAGAGPSQTHCPGPARDGTICHALYTLEHWPTARNRLRYQSGQDGRDLIQDTRVVSREHVGKRRVPCHGPVPSAITASPVRTRPGPRR